jgi:hypothetical protein
MSPIFGAAESTPVAAASLKGSFATAEISG